MIMPFRIRTHVFQLHKTAPLGFPTTHVINRVRYSLGDVLARSSTVSAGSRVFVSIAWVGRLAEESGCEADHDGT